MSVSNTAISGMNASQQNLSVIGNNIANSKTTGFKNSYMNFADSSYQGAVGNQIGTGVRVSSVLQDYTQGGIDSTGRALDMAITNGNGFFVERNPSSGSQNFSRAGNFTQDNEGYIISASGHNVQGYMATDGVLSAVLTDIQVPTTPFPANTTTGITFDLNLDATSSSIAAAFDRNTPSTYTYRNDTQMFDSLGISHTLTTYYIKRSANNWDVQVYEGATNLLAAPPATLTFNTNGTLNAASAGLGTIIWSPTGAAVQNPLVLSYGSSTQYGNPSQISGITQDGYSSGVLNSITVDNNGVITGQYSNGKTGTIAQVALATFPNANGLFSNGGSSWGQTNSSGAALIQPSNSADAFQAGALEGSNVDLTKELVNLILAQRTFQANAQTITVSNAVLQTVIDIR